MKKLIAANLSGRKVLLLFFITNIVYCVMLFVAIPQVMGYAGGMKLLDMMPTGYSVEYVNSLLHALGDEGRNAYLYRQIPVDMIYPFLFGVTYCLLVAYVLNKLGRLEGYLSLLCYLPLLSGLFDYCENAGIIIMLKTYPGNSMLLSQITNVFSVFKSTTTTITFISLIILLSAWGISRLIPKQK